MNSFGKLFKITTFGESHGTALGVVIDGCPAGLELDLELIKLEMDRRRPGQSKLVSPRKESDQFEVLSGIFEGKTTGMPLCLVVYNHDAKSKDYNEIKDVFRPGHADFGYYAKYRHRDYRGGGRSSARETVGRVLGGAVARQLISKHGIKVVGGVSQIGNVKAINKDFSLCYTNELNCIDADLIEAMRQEVEKARKDRDSVGGMIELQAYGVPVGLGEPVFDKLDAVIAGAMMSLPAVKGVEIGEGLNVASKRGTEINDQFFSDGFKTNYHGGILGGISTGAPIVVRFAVKPTSSIPQEKKSIDVNMQEVTVATYGRHDPCVAIRAVPIAEAMLCLVLADALLIDLAWKASREPFSPISSIKYGLKGEY